MAFQETFEIEPDTDALVLDPVVKRVVPAAEAEPLPLPAAPITWADYLVQAAESIASRSARPPTVGQPKTRKPRYREGGATHALLTYLRENQDPAGIEGSEIWPWFHEKFPKHGRSTVNTLLIRLETLGFVESFPSPAGGQRRRFRSAPFPYPGDSR